MVNLARLRKKAKEKKQAEAEAAEPVQPLPAEPPAEPAKAAEAAATIADVDQPAPDASPDRIAQYVAAAGEAVAEDAEVEIRAEGSLLELLTFELAGEHYAIDIEEVVEIVTPRSVTRVPNAGSTIVGILSLRGTIITLLDLRTRLGHGSRPAGPDARIIVAQHDSDHVGFLVDRVLRVVKIEPSEIQPHPVVHSSESDESVRGVFRHGDALTILLDLRKLVFSGSEWN